MTFPFTYCDCCGSAVDPISHIKMQLKEVGMHWVDGDSKSDKWSTKDLTFCHWGCAHQWIYLKCPHSGETDPEWKALRYDEVKNAWRYEKEVFKNV